MGGLSSYGELLDTEALLRAVEYYEQRVARSRRPGLPKTQRSEEGEVEPRRRFIHARCIQILECLTQQA